MLEAGENLALMAQPLDRHVGGAPRRSDLHGDGLLIFVVVAAGFEDDPHAPAPDLAHQPVRTHAASDPRLPSRLVREVSAVAREAAGREAWIGCRMGPNR